MNISITNDQVREVVSDVAFADLMSFAGADGVIDTSPGSEFDIWRVAAAEVGVDLKSASELFSWLNEVVLSADDSWQATESPDVFVRELRHLEKLGVLGRLDEVNLILRAASKARRTMTLEEVAAEVLEGKAENAAELV